ncbi:MAG: hypothetical protein AAGA38_05955 [Pseudomonadota bacterium]
MAYIFMQAGLGEASHFNLSTPFNEFMYTIVMAYGAVLLVAGIGVFGYAAWADHDANLSPALRLGTVLGFGLSFLLTLLVAGYIGGNGSSLVGTPSADHSSLQVFGWSMEVGDLRPAHFLALHAMQALPLFGAFLDHFAAPKRLALVWFGATAYALATAGLFFQALSGRPFIAV